MLPPRRVCLEEPGQSDTQLRQLRQLDHPICSSMNDLITRVVISDR